MTTDQDQTTKTTQPTVNNALHTIDIPMFEEGADPPVPNAILYQQQPVYYRVKPTTWPIPEGGLTPVEEIDAFDWNAGCHERFCHNPSFYHLDPSIEYHLMMEDSFKVDPSEHHTSAEIGKTIQDWERISLQPDTCPLCHGKGSNMALCVGVKTGIKIKRPFLCPCKEAHRYFANWSGPNPVPSRFHDQHALIFTPPYVSRLTYANANGDPEANLRFRRLLLAVFREYHTYSMFLAGPTGTGKTSLLIALYSMALSNWASRAQYAEYAAPSVWRTSACHLADQQHAFIMRRDEPGDDGPPAPVPMVTASKVRDSIKYGFMPSLFLDEFDKYKISSEFQARMFHELIDRITADGGQVVVASNLSPDAYIKKGAANFTEPVIRRISGAPNGVYINFWKGEVHVNGRKAYINANKELALFDLPGSGKPATTTTAEDVKTAIQPQSVTQETHTPPKDEPKQQRTPPQGSRNDAKASNQPQKPQATGSAPAVSTQTSPSKGGIPNRGHFVTATKYTPPS